MKRFDCPCCGGKGTVEEEMVGGFGICEICGWEEDGLQQRYPDELGPNKDWTLNEARKAWAAGETLFESYPNPKGK